MIRTAILFTAIALGSLAARAQTAPASGAFTISGVVRSATTGAPLDRAQVTLSTTGSDETQVAETLTGEGGAFRFDHLAAGKYALAAFRRGYIGARYEEHAGGYSTAIVTGDGLVSQGLSLNLFPPAVMDGSITDDNGDAAGDARVTLYRQQQQDGQSKVVTVDAETTDDDGTYEFDRLDAGTYYIGVSAEPWYAFHPPQRSASDGTPLPLDQQPHSRLDVAYPVTFYANATDSGSATPIQIHAGDHSKLDMTLHAVPAVHVAIQMPKTDSRQIPPIPQLEREVFGDDGGGGEQFQASGQTSIRTVDGQTLVDIGGIAPGHYTLRDFGENGASRSTALDLSTDQTVDLGAAGNAVDVSGRLEMASGAALPPVTMLLLKPGGGGSSVSASTAADGSFDLHGVPPGDFTVQVNSSSGPLDILQMAASGAQLHGHRITVGSDPVLLAAELSHGSVSVSGFARRDGRGIGGALVLLVPDHPQDNGDLFRLDQSDSDGSFTLSRVVPGDYTLVAIENGWSLEWSHPAEIASYVARGVKLHITEQPANLDLPSPVAVQ
jgi:uncharacterized protein (DUF2141 family)